MADSPSISAPQGVLVEEAALDVAARYSGDPWHPGNPYFAAAEPVMGQLWLSIGLETGPRIGVQPGPLCADRS